MVGNHHLLPNGHQRLYHEVEFRCRNAQATVQQFSAQHWRGDGGIACYY